MYSEKIYDTYWKDDPIRKLADKRRREACDKHDPRIAVIESEFQEFLKSHPIPEFGSINEVKTSLWVLFVQWLRGLFVNDKSTTVHLSNPTQIEADQLNKTAEYIKPKTQNTTFTPSTEDYLQLLGKIVDPSLPYEMKVYGSDMLHHLTEYDKEIYLSVPDYRQVKYYKEQSIKKLYNVPFGTQDLDDYQHYDTLRLNAIHNLCNQLRITVDIRCMPSYKKHIESLDRQKYKVFDGITYVMM